MDIKKLQKVVVEALEDVKAQDIKMYDTTKATSLFDRVCIASGTSNRQTKALASSVREKVKENGGHIIGIEGEDIGEWVLVDLGDMVVHIMQPVIRGYYRLEELWGDNEIKVGAEKRLSKSVTKLVTKRVTRHATEPSEETKIEGTPKRVRSATKQTGQTLVDEDIKKSDKKPRTTGIVDETKPKRATRTKASMPTDPTARKPASRTKAIGTTVKVAASKSALASAKQAATKRATSKRKASA